MSLNPVPFSWMLLGFVACLVFGGVSGGLVVHKYYRVVQLEAELKAYKTASKKLADAIDLGEAADIADDNVEKSNEQIYDAVVQKLRAPVPALAGDTGEHVLIDAGGMRQLGEFR